MRPYGHESRRDSKPRMTVSVQACGKLLVQTRPDYASKDCVIMQNMTSMKRYITVEYKRFETPNTLLDTYIDKIIFKLRLLCYETV
jgi:hypothetical protein